MKFKCKTTLSVVAVSAFLAFTSCTNADLDPVITENSGNVSQNSVVEKTVVPLANCVSPGWASQNGGTTVWGTKNSL